MKVSAETEQIEINIEPIIGDFKPSEKFIGFIGGKGHINFIANEATIEAKYLSGLDMDDIVLKLTIFENGTVNFDEVDTNFTTKEQRGRLLDVIQEKSITQFRGRMVVQELPFKSIAKIKDEIILLYLSVECKKPIDILSSYLDDDDIELEPIIISDSQSSKLDDLMSMFDEDITDDEDILQEEVIVNEEVIPVSNVKNQMEESFAKMKQDKIDELSNRIKTKKKELSKFQMDTNLSQKKVDSTQDEIKLLESRLDNLKPQDDFTGYYFNVSERLNEKVTLDPDIHKVILDKISKVKAINPEAFMKLFESGEYHIRLGTKSNEEISEVTDYKGLPDEVKSKLSDMELTIVDDKLIYYGEMSWGDIVNKMVKLGFGQESEFDKYCGSNSYKMKQDYIDEVPEIATPEPIVNPMKLLKSFDSPTDLVVLGSYHNGSDVEIDDDYSSFNLSISGKMIKSCECDGHLSILSIDKYKEWINDDNECNDGVEAFLIPNFIGDINVGVIGDDGKFISDFNVNDYIMHQNLDDNGVGVFLDFPIGTEFMEIDGHDLNKVKSYIRDITIDNIVK